MPDAPPSGSSRASTTPSWGLGDAAIGMVVALVGGAVALSVALAATGYEDADVEDLPISLLAYGQLGQWIGFAVVPYVALRLKGEGLVRGLGLRFERRDLWVGGLIGAATQLVLVPLLSYPWLWLINEDTDEISRRADLLGDRAGTFGAAFLLVLIVGLGAPFFEELFYRGLVQGALRKRGLAPAVAIGVTALVFAAAHMSVAEFPALFGFALVVGTLAHRAGRLGPWIAAHVAFNLVTVIVVIS